MRLICSSRGWKLSQSEFLSKDADSVRSKIYRFRFASKTSWRRLQDMSSRRLQDMSSRRLQDMSSRRLQDMPSRRPEDVFSVTMFRLPRRLQDVFRDVFKTFSRSLQDVLKTSWKTKNFYAKDVLKTSSRRLEDQQMFAGIWLKMKLRVTANL